MKRWEIFVERTERTVVVIEDDDMHRRDLVLEGMIATNSKALTWTPVGHKVVGLHEIDQLEE